jgi:hypothetical protein
MNAPHADQIISGYLARLEQALADVPPARRAELVNDVRRHIAEARSAQAEETDATILNILDKLGEPADIAAAARDGLGARPAPMATPVGVLEIATIVALVLVWPAGLALVWLSSAWSQRDKLIATVLWPGGVLALAILSAASGGYFSHWYIFFLAVLLTPVVWSIGAIFLAIRLYQSRLGNPSAEGSPTGRGGALEIAAIVLTPLFWPVGVTLLWTSRIWNTRDKLIGTLVPPGGYFGVAAILMILGMASGGSCTSTSDSFGNATSTCTAYGLPRWALWAVTLVLLVLPLCTAAYLAVRLRGARLFKPAVAS